MPTMSTQTVVLPGDSISSSSLPPPSPRNTPLKLGPGLRRLRSSTVISTVGGLLNTDEKRNAIWIEANNGRYIPIAGDFVIATVHHSSAEAFHCSITAHTSHVKLPHLAFENVTKKSRPQLVSGALVYAKILSASKYFDPEMLCYNASTGKSEGMGELKGGMLFDISLGMARRLQAATGGGVCVLEELAPRVAFEVAVGSNGLVWVNSGSVKETLLIGRILQQTDSGVLNIVEQKKLVNKFLKSF